MPRRISRLGGTTLRRSFMTKAYSPAIFHGGPRNGPPPPHRPARPGRAVAVLYLKLTSGCYEQAAVLRHHAAILDHTDPRASERLRGGVVADAELEPHHRRLPRQPRDLRRVTRQELRAAEDLDDVGGLAQVGQRGGDRLAEDGLVGSRRVDGQHAVAAGLQICRHVVRRLRRLTLRAEHRSEERRVGKECRSRWSPYH